MTVTQKGDRVEIETKSKVGEGQERVGKDAYVLDGKETDFTMPGPGGGAKKAKRTIKWTDDGNGFDVTEESVLNAPDGGEVTARATRRWRLSADGKTLTIEMEVEHRGEARLNPGAFSSKTKMTKGLPTIRRPVLFKAAPVN
jgi:hypothetical protein